MDLLAGPGQTGPAVKPEAADLVGASRGWKRTSTGFRIGRFHWKGWRSYKNPVLHMENQ